MRSRTGTVSRSSLPDISARAVMGMALILALESHHSKKFDRDRAVALISEGTVKGFFPTI